MRVKQQQARSVYVDNTHLSARVYIHTISFMAFTCLLYMCVWFSATLKIARSSVAV